MARDVVESGQAGNEIVTDRIHTLMEEAVAQTLLNLFGSSGIELSAYSLESIADQVLESAFRVATEQGLSLQRIVSGGR